MNNNNKKLGKTRNESDVSMTYHKDCLFSQVNNIMINIVIDIDKRSNGCVPDTAAMSNENTNCQTFSVNTLKSSNENSKTRHIS